MANMVETLRLGWSENLPLSQLAWGKITRARQITALLPLLTENYDLSNDVLYTAQKRGSVLLNAMLDGVKPEANPNVRWLLLVAHDTNIAMVRTLMNFSWQLPGYSRGNIPPGSSLVLERWRNAKSGERYLRVYFQAQGLDDLRRLQTPDAQHPMLRQEWRQPGCRQTDVGTLCPFQGGHHRAGSAYRPVIRPGGSHGPAVAARCLSGPGKPFSGPARRPLSVVRRKRPGGDLRRGDHPAVQHPAAYQPSRRDVERRIVNGGPRRRPLYRAEAARHSGHFRRRALLNGDRRPVRAMAVEGGLRGSDVKRDLVIMGQNRQRIGADFIRHVAVGGDTVGADPHRIHLPLRHQAGGH